MSLSDWSIRSKSIMIVGSLSALILLVGVISYVLLSSTNHATENIGGNWLPSVRAAGQLQTSIARLRGSEARVSISDSAESLEVGLKTYANFDHDADQLIAQYKQKPGLGAENRAAIEAVEKTLAEFRKAAEKTIEAAKSGDRLGSQQIFMKNLPAYTPALKAVDALAELNQRGATADIGLAESNYRLAVTIIAVCLTIALLVAALSFLLITRTISAPIRSITATMRRLADQDLSITVREAGRKDEIGAMAAALQVFRDKMIEAEKLRREQSEEQEKRLQRSAAVERLVAEFDASISAVIGQVTQATGALDGTARTMSSTADATNSQVTVVAAAAEQASHNVQTVAAAAEELSSSINEIGRQVAESARFAGQATQQARDTDRQISGLSEAAQKIGDVVQLINDIASQTNLLALNATIEAARAGEAGKGFAVVANEVKHLANQTARATEEISGKVAEMQAATGQSVEAVKAIAATIGRIAEISTGIAAAVDEQNAATGEIARNVQQAAQGTQEVSSSIVQVAQGAAQTGNAAGEVLRAAENLGQNAEGLRRQVDAFLGRIKSV